MLNCKVSVYLPTRNRRSLLERALTSVLRQDFRPLEIIVVDDASTDGTSEFLTDLAKRQEIRHLRMKSPRGAPAARNLALTSATGDLVTGLDDDDEWLPERVSRMVRSLSDDLAFVCASDIIVRDDCSFIAYRPARITHSDLLRRNVVGNQVLARRKDVLACHAFDESLPASQDYDLWIRLTQRFGPAKGLAEPLQIVHAQKNRARISNSNRRRHGLWTVYVKHRKEMSRAERKSHLFNLLRTRGRKISWKYAMIFMSKEDFFRIMLHRVRSSYPGIDRLTDRLFHYRDQAAIKTVLVPPRDD